MLNKIFIKQDLKGKNSTKNLQTLSLFVCVRALIHAHKKIICHINRTQPMP